MPGQSTNDRLDPASKNPDLPLPGKGRLSGRLLTFGIFVLLTLPSANAIGQPQQTAIGCDTLTNGQIGHALPHGGDAARKLHPQREGQIRLLLICPLDHQQVTKVQPAGIDLDQHFASGGDARVDLEDVDYSDTQWWFLAVTYDPMGLAMMMTGDAAGVMRWMALETAAVGTLTSIYPLHLGQDGTGTYAHNLAADIDDLAIWRRALSMDELHALYASGQGAPVIP